MTDAIKAVPVMAGSAIEKLRPAQGGGSSSDGPLSLPDAQAVQRVDGRRRRRGGDGVVSAAFKQGAGPRKTMSGTIPVPERVTVVMRLLVEAAEEGRAAPSGKTLAAAIGTTSTGTAADVIALLETMNLITVERTRNARVVTIVESGKSTKMPSRMSAAVRDTGAEARSANRRKRIALFYDALSCGTPDAPVTIKQAGIVAGVSEPTAISFMKEVRADLGWQAQ